LAIVFLRKEGITSLKNENIEEFFKREFWRYVIVISILTVVDLGQVYIPQFTKSAIDSISKNDVSSLIRFSIYIAIVSIGIVVLRFCISIC